MRLTDFIRLTVLLMCLGGCSSRSDLEQVCQAFVELGSNPNFDSMSYDQRMQFVEARVSLSLFSKVAPMWDLVPNSVPEARYRMFKQSADELLAAEWECPEMKRLAPLISEPITDAQ